MIAALKPAVLLVDDSQLTLLATEGFLESDVYDIITACNGEEALCRLREGREFALMLLDMRMPGMDGLDVARAIKSAGHLASLPICFLTSSGDNPSLVMDAYKAGAVDFITKPVEPRLLRAKVGVFIELWEATRQLEQRVEARTAELKLEVAARKQAEETVRASLEEKEVLLREIHHRVKNNLQVVSSLLLLQRGQVEDPGLKAVFEEAEGRIRSMALVHERLYREHTLSNLDFADYLSTLAEELIQGASTSATVKLETDLDSVRVPVDTAIPLGLIATELVTNALKYAYRGRKEGVLKITLKPAGENRFELAVADDGPGRPEGFDPAKATSLGLRLVRMLAQQIRGTVTFIPGAGGACHVHFPLQPCDDQPTATNG